MDNKKNELEALNNCLRHYNLTDYKIHEYFQQDKRRTKQMYFLTDGKGTSLTGNLDYSELNNFIRGYGKAASSHDALVKVLKEIAVKYPEDPGQTPEQDQLLCKYLIARAQETLKKFELW